MCGMLHKLMLICIGAKIRDAEMRYLGAMVHGAELGVCFLKSLQKECTCENLSTKG
jgi:hypothetical protein